MYTIITNSIISQAKSKSSRKSIENININTSATQSNNDKSVVSSITWEMILSKQSQTKAWLDRVNTALSQILLAIQSGKTSTLSQPSTILETVIH